MVTGKKIKEQNKLHRQKPDMRRNEDYHADIV